MNLSRIPSSLSTRESRLLKRLVEGKRVVECGALLGYSTLVLASTASRVVSIDRHEGYNTPTFRPFMSNLEGSLDKITPIKGEMEVYLPKVEPYEVLFVDLDGSARTTRAAINLARSGSLIAIHDYGRTRCAGVEIAIKESGLAIIQAVDTLVVLRKP